MKATFLLCGILMTLCLFTKVKADCLVDGEMLPPGEHIRQCQRLTCHDSGAISAVGCATYACKDQIGYKEMDLSKPYPECCGGPICKSNV